MCVCVCEPVCGSVLQCRAQLRTPGSSARVHDRRACVQLSSFSTGLISLVLSDPAATGAPAVPANATAVVDSIQTRHTDRFRITARTAYIAVSPASPSPASAASQAAVLLSALAAGETLLLIVNASRHARTLLHTPRPGKCDQWCPSIRPSLRQACTRMDTQTAGKAHGQVLCHP